MDRDTAIRIDGAVSATRSSLNGLAQLMKEELADDDFRESARHVGAAMAAMHELSSNLYQDFEDITPDNMKPPSA